MKGATLNDDDARHLLENGGSLAIPYFGGAVLRVEPSDIPSELALPALRAFLERSAADQHADSHHLLAYWASTLESCGEDVLELLPDGTPPTAPTVWGLVRPTTVFFSMIEAGKYAPVDTAYIEVEAEVAWEPEHGLELSWESGRYLVKVGPFDGHPTNGHAYAKPEKDRFVFLGGSPEESTLRDPR
jgi:hypothetical protein